MHIIILKDVLLVIRFLGKNIKTIIRKDIGQADLIQPGQAKRITG